MRYFYYITLLLFTFQSVTAADSIIYIENSNIKLGVNLDLGGSITYLAKQGDDNIINNYDWGRQIQMSFYSGPNPYIPESGQQPHEAWAFLGWNPIQSGDVGGYKSKVVDYFHGTDSIYVKSIPMQWPLENVPGECYFESYIKIDGNTVRVNSRLLNNRKDKTQYPGRSQELPAVYVNGPYHKLLTYKGNTPFKNDAMVEIPQNSETEPKWSYWQATENWVAHVNDEGQGLGIVTPDVQSYVGGFFSKKGTGGSKDVATGYCAPIVTEILDYNIEYDYSYALIVGSIDEIRSYAYNKRTDPRVSSFNFEKTRNHIYYTHAIDKGWPIKGQLEIIPNAKTIYINSPKVFYVLNESFYFTLNGLFPDNVKDVSLICTSLDAKQEEVYKLAVQKDNLFHNYKISLRIKNSKSFILGEYKIKVDFHNIQKGKYLKIRDFGLN